MTLDQIAADLQRRISIETNSAKVEVFSVIANLVSALQPSAGPDPRDAAIAKLQQEVDSLNLSNQQQNDILQQLKRILEVPEDRTMTYLPMRAQELMDQLRTKL
jgi:hypothetical protein